MKTHLLIVIVTAMLSLSACTLKTKNPSGKILVFGEQREQVVQELREMGIRAETVDYWSLETEDAIFIQGKLFFDEATIEKISSIIEIDVKHGHYKNHSYKYYSGLYLPSKGPTARGFAGNCSGFMDITLDEENIYLVRSKFTGTAYIDDPVIKGQLNLNNGEYQMLVDNKILLRFVIEWNSTRQTTVIRLLHKSDPSRGGCIIPEKSDLRGFLGSL